MNDEDWLLELQDIARVGIWQWDPQTDLLQWSPGMLSIHGIPKVPGAAADVVNFILPADRPHVEQVVQQTLVDGQPRSVEYRIQRGDGTERTLHARVRVAPGPPRRLVGTVQDITGERELSSTKEETRRLREQQEFTTRLINVAAHELKTPLTPIRIHVELLARAIKKPDAPEARSLAALQRALVRLDELVNDFLETARLQSKALKLRMERFPLDEMLAEAIESYRAVAEKLGVRLVTEIQPDVVVTADRTRLLQVANNLLSNAIKFTSRGGTVRVEARAEGDHAIITVTDTGAGFTAAQGQDLFKPFSQVHDPEQMATGGTGLGLYIARGLVEAHGGTLEASSAGPSKGATFEVKVPRTASGDLPRRPRAHRTPMEDRLRSLI